MAKIKAKNKKRNQPVIILVFFVVTMGLVLFELISNIIEHLFA